MNKRRKILRTITASLPLFLALLSWPNDGFLTLTCAGCEAAPSIVRSAWPTGSRLNGALR